ncbi:flagellar export chaperone FlgN [Massilia aurea]|uniref:flagellar export chaperone FlgN n=1 Tax=Massilia aurea TaxID=373040 RepID=UPI0034618ED9
MATLTRSQANALLADGVTLDVRETATILMLLERQFDAAVRHRSAELTALADELGPLLEAMEARRQQRVQLVRALLGAQGTMAQYIATLAPGPRDAFEAAWHALEQTVRACQDATFRNGQLLADQHSVMQRVLHGEDQLYAPR